MGAGAVQVGHFRQDAGGRPGKQPGQGRHRLERPVCGTATIVPVVNQERGGQAQQRLDRQERHLPAARDRAPCQQRPELLTCLADRQVEVVSQVSHGARLSLPRQPRRLHRKRSRQNRMFVSGAQVFR